LYNCCDHLASGLIVGIPWLMHFVGCLKTCLNLQIVALANLLPADDEVDELDSFMFQTVSVLYLSEVYCLPYLETQMCTFFHVFLLR